MAAEPQPIPAGLTTRSWACLALAAGLLELGVIQAHWFLVGTLSMRDVRTNQNYLWMVPASVFLVLGALRLISVPLTRLAWPGPVRTIPSWLACFIAVGSPLWAIEELHPFAAAVLAAGAATRLAPWLGRDGQHRLAQRSLPWLAAIVALVAALGAWRGLIAEPVALATLPPPPASAPNVVLMVWDTVRADHLTHHGYQRATTPRLDELAARGIVFEQARSTAPWTLPSHASMFTGRWPHELSVSTDRPLGSGPLTVAEALRDRGYVTGGFVGNSAYASSWFGLDRGFLHYEDDPKNREVSFGELVFSSGCGRLIMRLAEKAGLARCAWAPRGNTADLINRNALAWLDQFGPTRPFFLFLNYMDAHGPYNTPEGFPRRFLPERPDAEFHQILPHLKTARRNDPDPDNAALLERASALCRDAYDDCLRFVDHQTHALMEALEARGLADNTWIIITSDHGEQFGEHGLFLHGNSLYRPLVHVPLVIVPPRGRLADGPQRVATPVSARELAATIADLTQAAPPQSFPGRSLARFWDGSISTTDASAEPVLLETASPRRQARGLVWGTTTYIRYKRNGLEEAFDLDSDPEERHNLADDPRAQATLARLRTALDALGGETATR